MNRSARPSARIAPLPVPPREPGRLWAGFPGIQPPLICRAHELSSLGALLEDPASRIVTVTGPGGVGKTRLAIAAAEASLDAFPAGSVFTSLAAVRDPDLVISVLARALNVPESAGRPLVDGVVASLRVRRLLLILDNFEHVLAASTLVTELLNRCEQLTVIVTSRAPLGLGTERRFPVQPLGLPPIGVDPNATALVQCGAVALFDERARWAQPAFSLENANGRAVADTCRRLDGVPLAIELASAWMRVIAPEELERLLDPALPQLRSGPTERPDRQRTMRDTIAWSYGLLSSDEARLFRALGIFVGGFTHEGALAIGQAVSPGLDSVTLLDGLASLVDKSLLQASVEGGQSRLRMLETVREFALEILDADGDIGPVAAAHAAHMVAFAEAAEPHLLGPDEVLWLDRCEAELGNLRAALAWALEHDHGAAVRIAGSLWLFWNWYRLEEGRTWLQRALAQAQSQGHTLDHTMARGYTTCTALAVLSGDAADAKKVGELAVDVAAATGDQALEGLARWVLTTRNLLDPAFDRSGTELDQALPLMNAGTSTSVRAQTAYATSHRGVAAFSSGDLSGGMAYYERAVALARVAGSRAMLLVILGDYAGWCVEFGDNGRARELAVEALALARDESLWAVGSPLSCLALLAATNGQPKLAAGLLGVIEAAVANTGLAIPKHFVRRLDRARDLAGAQLGDHFSQAYAAGVANPRQLMADAAAQTEGFSLFRRRSMSSQLSPRQVEVLRLIVAGRSDRQIAEDLFISHRTVSSHVAAILNKLDASSRSELAVRAVREGLI